MPGSLVRSTCCYCGVGCGVVIETAADRITGIKGDPDHPANFGRLCTKGSTLHLTVSPEGRALYPELRRARSLPRKRATWNEALDFVADRFSAIIREHGPDAVAFYLSGQLLTEDYYVFNKLSKGLIGTNNVDSNSRLCMSSAVAGYQATLGADSVPACYEDIDHAECILIAGSNTAYAHPVLFRRVEDARAKNPDLKLIVVDPRATDTAAVADLHLPLLPGADVALFNAILHVLIWDGLVDQPFVRAHTTGFDALKEAVREYTPQAAADLCGVPAEDITLAARWFGSAHAALSLYCQGLNQSTHGADSNAALINLHLATGHIGRPGAGPFSLTGQPNAMGGREVGGMANLLSAHRNLANPAHRQEIAKLWGVESVSEKPGKTAVELFEAVAKGEIKAVWISCTNPAHSMPDVTRVREALNKAELVVVQEAYRNTDTVAFADVLLPAASWGEKEGTVTNSERRISRVRQAVFPPGEARPDWEAAVAFARRIEERLRPVRPTLFPYRAAEDVFNEHRESTRGRDLDITGLSYALLENRGPQQWPFPEGATSGKARLFADGVFPTPDGRARFAVAAYRPPAEKTDARYPLRLNTGRLRDQWHGMSRTGTVARLFEHGGEPAACLHPEDMLRRGVKNGDFVRISSRRGKLILAAIESAEVRPGQVFVPMHWNNQFLKGQGVNALTLSAFDPVSKQPELKHAAVRIEKVELPWRMAAMASGGSGARREALQALLEQFDFASCVPFGREREGVLFRAASQEPATIELLARIDHIFGLDDENETLRYLDSHRGISKLVRIHGDELVAVRLCGETAACDWLKDTMAGAVNVSDLRRWVLAPLARPPAGFAPRGRVICSCLNVPEHAIREALEAGADLPALQAKFKCGIECGSCLPEIKRMLVAKRAA